MIWLTILLGAVILLAGLWIFAIAGRKSPRMEQFRANDYAHRGLHQAPDRPENSMAAFRAAFQHKFGVELDVHLLKDGGLAVIHDSPLVRTTGAAGKIEDLVTEELKNYPLEGTKETIPTLREVLELHKTTDLPLLIELKPAGGNHAALCRALCAMLEEYPDGKFLIESFDPRCLLWLKKHRPDILRGQLAQNFIKHPSGQPRILDFVLTALVLNLATRPDFVAYKFADRKDLPFQIYRKVWKLPAACWTIDTPADYAAAKKDGQTPIFEKFLPGDKVSSR